MNFIGLVIGYVVLLGGGFGVTVLLQRGAARFNLVECLCLSWLFGTGTVSLLLWLFGLFCAGAIVPSLVSACCLALSAIGWLSSKNKFSIPRPRNWREWIFAGLLATQIGIVFWIALTRPLGWDGLIIWETKARFAFLSNNVLPANYYDASRLYTHPEYPLGIPLTELWFYLWMGDANQWWIKIVFATFYAVGVVLLAIITTRLTRERWLGFTTALLFFFVPSEISGLGSATSGYVDFPLSIFYLVAIGYLLLSLGDNAREFSFRIFAAALFFLPWLKREGNVLWLIAVAAGIVVVLVRRKPRAWLAALAPGAAIILGWNLYLRHVHLQMPSEFLQISFSTLRQNADRIVVASRVLLELILDKDSWGIFWVFAALAVVALVWRMRNLGALILLGATLIPLAVYTSIYVFSAYPHYGKHIAMSLPRLLVQVVPVLWLAIAAAIASPHALSARAQSKRCNEEIP
jgi:hypothetical protein